MHPIVFQLRWNLDGDWPIRRQNLHRVYRALEQIQEKSFQELNTLFKVFVIIYADDTVVLAESEEGMQNALDIFQKT
jgi:hypothetical protein